MRLDKYLCDTLGVTRKEAGKIIKRGEVSVNALVIKNSALKLLESDTVHWQERPVILHGPKYIMLYKPQDFVCSHQDDYHHSALMLLDEPHIKNLHFAGRLDADTTGLVLISDDGQWSHRITSPKHRCEKVYRVWLADPIQPDYPRQFAEGILLRQERDRTLPAHLEVIQTQEARLTIYEGKYHQVKRMFAALGNKVVALHREQIGRIVLDHTLEPGESRYLTDDEIQSVWSSHQSEPVPA
jgi:16S rRNA pseudouridine516 synthase